MDKIQKLLDNNQHWADDIEKEEPGFFSKLAAQQSPEYLWVGCSDSRVPANEIVGLLPGELFVHRNVANVIMHTDLNCLSVIQYAVEVLKVKHIIICGHYGCGGVQEALREKQHGLIDYWLRAIKDIRHQHEVEIKKLPSEKEQINLLCELNVHQQVANICHTPIIQNAWKRGQELSVHGLIYSIEDGLLKSLDTCVTSIDQIATAYRLDG